MGVGSQYQTNVVAYLVFDRFAHFDVFLASGNKVARLLNLLARLPHNTHSDSYSICRAATSTHRKDNNMLGIVTITLSAEGRLQRHPLITAQCL